MGFLDKLFMPQSKAVASNVNQKLLTNTYSPVMQQGITGGNYLYSLLTGQGPDVGAANAGYQDYLDNAGYDAALRRMSQSVVGGGAASGLLRSGATSEALLNQGAEINQSYYNNYLQALGGLSDMGQQAGQLVGNAGAGQVVKKPSILSTIASPLGGVAAQLKGSDRRMKRDVDLIETLPDGLNIYTFRYRDDLPDELAAYVCPGQHVGVMADEVERLRPWALGPTIAGYQTVNYGAL